MSSFYRLTKKPNHETLNREIIFEKLKHYEIKSKQNVCFGSFLGNRKQYVSVEGFIFQTQVVKYGVSQGSTLGPFLFLIYINDLTNTLEKSIVHHFADEFNYMAIKILQLNLM